MWELIHDQFLPGAFLVPYLLMLLVLGIPLLYMELTVGQYTRRGPVHALASVCPLLKGIITHVLFRSSHTLINPWQASLPDRRGGHGVRGHLLHHVHLLQHRHHLGPLLPLQLFPGPSPVAELQQHLEHAQLHGPRHQQQLHIHGQPGVLQVRFNKRQIKTNFASFNDQTRLDNDSFAILLRVAPGRTENRS